MTAPETLQVSKACAQAHGTAWVDAQALQGRPVETGLFPEQPIQIDAAAALVKLRPTPPQQIGTTDGLAGLIIPFRKPIESGCRGNRLTTGRIDRLLSDQSLWALY
jgi:hypothetical protein